MSVGAPKIPVRVAEVTEVNDLIAYLRSLQTPNERRPSLKHPVVSGPN